MKLTPLALCAALLGTACGSAQAVEIWHSNTVWANGGICSASFTLDAGMDEMTNLKIQVQALDPKGSAIGDGVLEVDELGTSSATRYGSAFFEDSAACEDNLTIVIKKASAVMNGKTVDLIKTKNISVREFKPFSIRIGK